MSDKMSIKKMDLSQIKYDPIDGEVVIDAITEKVMIYHEGKWVPVTSDGAGLSLGLYDLNKQIIAQLPELADLNKAIQTIGALHEMYHNKYYMLYGKEISYFTLFKLIEPQYFAQEVLDCLRNVGKIKAIDPDEPGTAVEIWVETDDGPTCLYLFPYDSGLVQVGE